MGISTGINDIIRFIQSKRCIITITLALIAIGIEYFYITCETACFYLKGNIFGIELEYIGIAYMVAIIGLSTAGYKRAWVHETMRDRDSSTLKPTPFPHQPIYSFTHYALLVLLSSGIGIEVYLVGFQIWYNIYCYYCLAFGGILMLQFFVNCDWKKKRLILSSMVIALILFSLVFRGSATPVYAEEMSLHTFGSGKVLVRIYTDYFCSPCKNMEPSLEPVITDLVKKNIITLTFIDTPFYKFSSLYASYFLYGLNEKKSLEHALLVRNALIEASNQKICEPDKLEAFLNTKGIKIKSFDTKPTFDLFGKFLRDDQIKATPSCVIEKEGKKEVFVGGKDIIQALQLLK